MLALLCYSAAEAATITAVASGDWSSNSTWDCGCVPGAGDDVVIARRTVTVSSPQAANSIQLLSHSSANSILKVQADLIVSGTLDFTQTTGSKDLILYIDGSATLSVAGDLLMDHSSGDDQIILLNNYSGSEARLLVLGNVTYSKPGTSGDDLVLGLRGANSLFTVGGQLTMSHAGSSDRMTFDLNGGAMIVAGNSTINSTGGTVYYDMDGGDYTTSDLTITYGGNQDVLLYVDSDSKLNVTGNLTTVHNGGDDVLYYVNQNGGTNAELTVGGYFDYDKPTAAGDDLALLTDDANSVFNVAGSMDIDISGSGDRTTFNIDNGTFTIGGAVNADLNGGAGRLYFDLDGGTLTMPSLTVDHDGSEDLLFYLDNDARMTIAGDLIAHMTSGDDLLFRLNHGPGSDAALHVGNDLLITHDGNADDMVFDINKHAKLSVGNDLIINTTMSGGDYLDIDLANDQDTLSIGGDFLVTSSGSSYNSGDDLVIDQNGGLITVGGDMTWTKNHGDDMLIVLDHACTLAVAGDLTLANNAGDFALLETNHNGSRLLVTGDLNLLEAGGDDMELEINSQSQMDIRGDVNLSAPAAGELFLDMNNSSQLFLGGSLVRQASPTKFGSLTMSNGSTMTMDGTTQQTIAGRDGDGGDSFSYSLLKLENTFAFTPQFLMDGHYYVDDEICFLDGIVQTTSSAMIIIEDGATATGGSDQSFVDGPMKKIGNEPFTFIVGDAGRYARIGMTAPTSNSDEFIAEYHEAAYTDVSNFEPGINNVSTNEYWDFQRVSGTSQVTLSLYWEDAYWSSINDIADLFVAKYSTTDTEWKHLGQAAATGTLGIGGSGNVVANLLIDGSAPITFGSGIPTVNSLPIELLSFEAELNGDQVDITWTTATEFNNDFFTVERSKDGFAWEIISIVPGAGISNTVLEYAEVDPEPYTGVSYYRLTQTDYDGTYTHSDVAPIKYVKEEDSQVNVYPNPWDKTTSVNVELNGFEGNDVLVSLRDITGKEYYSRVIVANNEVVYNVIEPMSELAAGMYLITVRSEDQIFSKQLVIK